MKFNKNFSKTFFVFLFLSLLIWLLITFSKEYVTQVSLNISYQALPQDKILEKQPVKEIKILAKGTGFKLMSTKFLNHDVVFKTNKLSKISDNNFYFLATGQKNEIQKQLVSGLQIQSFINDSIYLKIGSLVSKKVVVKPNLNIKYHVGFNALKPAEIIPDSILISGPNSQIKKIKELPLQSLILENVKENFTQTVAIANNNNFKNIKFNTKQVVVNGFVEKFTEGSFSIPFTVNNIPENVNITTFPKEITVVFKVDLPRFNAVNKNFFEVVCDYKFSEKNGFTYLIPKIVKQPSFVKNVKVIPSKIEFLIQK